MDEEQMSFMDSVSQRLSPAAEEVMEQDTTAMMDEEVKKEEPEVEESVDMPQLYQVVYGEEFNPADPQSEGRMRIMQEAIESDPRVAQMAKTEPEKFALFMYGRTSAIA